MLTSLMSLSPEDRRRRKADLARLRRQRRREEGIKETETPEQRDNRLRRQREYEARRRATDPEGFRQAQAAAAKRWRQRYPDRDRASTYRHRDKNRDKYNAGRRQGRYKNIVHYLHKEAKYRAKKAGIEFTITVEDIGPMGDACPIFGRAFVIGAGGRSRDAPSIDRIDPSQGYVPGNVWIISDRANRVKNDGTAEEHEMIAKAMRARKEVPPR